MKKLSHEKSRVEMIDKQIEEFDERDLGDDLRKSNCGKLFAPKRTMQTSIFLDRDLVFSLKEKAEKRGIGYQTMMKIIVAENISKY